MLDEMSTRKHVQWDGKKYRGFVDLGTDIDDDLLPEATEALVFMAVCEFQLESTMWVFSGEWSYGGREGEPASRSCTKWEWRWCRSRAMDQPHQAMLKLLGARLSADNMQAYFPHPCDNNEKIYVFLDACHMIK